MRANPGQECRDGLLTTELSSRDILVMEGERHRLARELHDGPLQTLAALGLRLDLCMMLSRNNDAAALEGELAHLKRDLQERLSHLRELMVEWRCPMLELEGFAEVTERYVRDFADRSDVEVSVDLRDLLDDELDSDERVAIFRVLQEALRNVNQHSRASRVRVRAVTTPSTLQVHVADNGRGFNVLGVTANYPRQGLGLAGMQERSEAIGGTLEIDSEPGCGTIITVTIPRAGWKS